MVCHVYSNTGLILPLAKICAMARAHGVFTIVDGAHGPGQLDFRIDALGCDAYAASLHK